MKQQQKKKKIKKRAKARVWNSRWTRCDPRRRKFSKKKHNNNNEEKKNHRTTLRVNSIFWKKCSRSLRILLARTRTRRLLGRRQTRGRRQIRGRKVTRRKTWRWSFLENGRESTLYSSGAITTGKTVEKDGTKRSVS